MTYLFLLTTMNRGCSIFQNREFDPCINDVASLAELLIALNMIIGF